MYNTAFEQIPVCIMFTGAVVSYIAYIILSRAFAKKHVVQLMPPFREFTFPGGTALGIMLMYLISALLVNAEAISGSMLHSNINLLFDIVVPFGFAYSDEELRTRVDEEVRKRHPDFFTVIAVDKDMVKH